MPQNRVQEKSVFCDSPFRLQEMRSKMNDKKQLWKGIAIGFALTLVLIQAVMFCNNFLGGHLQKENQVNLTNEEIQEKLTEIEGLMNDYFLDELDEQQIETWLYKGAVAGLGDPYAAYYTKEEYQSLLDSTNGSYCGIGVEISQNINTGIVTVARVFEDGPAMEAGLKPGDILYKVGDTEVTGMDLTMVVSQIKGEENTKVLISVVREGEEDYLEFQVERRTIEIQTVGSAMLENQIGYISITSFDDVTTAQFIKALDELEEQDIQGLIVDLRDNGGGLVSSVCAILDRLLPEGLIVYTEDKYGNREEETSDGENCFDKPLAVLVNGNSASASEIFAGAIKDYGLGVLVGTKTYGKGIVQKIYPLHDGTAVKLTVSKYYTPKGNNIHEIGIEPDVEIDLEEALKKEVVVSLEEDNQLQKAIEVVKQEIMESE